MESIIRKQASKNPIILNEIRILVSATRLISIFSRLIDSSYSFHEPSP